MRNQGWTQDGKLIKDDEIYLDGKVLRVKDHITDEVRDPTEAETEQFYWKPDKFERLNPVEGVEHRLTHIEEWLEKK